MKPSEAIDRLKEGNRRYVAGEFNPDDWGADRRQAANDADASSFAAVLACSDGRVPVELLFGQGIGDLFVVKSAGNRADNFGLASLDLAAAKLGVSLILVLGHSGCKAVRWALENPALPGRIPAVVDKVRSSLMRLREQAAVIPPDQLYERAVVRNTLHSQEEVKRQCQMVRKRMITGELDVVGAVYEVVTGEVRWL